MSRLYEHVTPESCKTGSAATPSCFQYTITLPFKSIPDKSEKLKNYRTALQLLLVSKIL